MIWMKSVVFCFLVCMQCSILADDAGHLVYASVSELRDSDVPAGSTVQTLGYHKAGDGGGAIYTIVDSSGAQQADGYADHVLDNDRVARLSVGSNLNPRTFGAVGDGKTDDSEAFISLDRVIENTDGPVHVHVPQGVFMINPLKMPLREMTPGKLRRGQLITLREDYSTFTAVGEIKIISGVDYTVNAKDGPEWIGNEWFWSVILIRANHCTVDGLKFNGNGTGTLKAYDANGYYPKWGGVSAFGEWDNKTCHVGNRVINSAIVGGGGHGVGLQYQKQALIANNHFEDTSGNGYSHSDDSLIIGNIAVNSHDAPYVVNGRCNNIVVANNVSRGTTNGSGIDIVGAFNVVIQGNVLEESAAWGILVSYSAQQKIHSGDVVITDNILIRNCRSTDTPINAEVCVGLPWKAPDDRLGAVDVVVSNNKFIIDGSHGEFKGRFVVLGKGTERIQVTGNTVTGTPNVHREVLSVTSPSRDLLITGNTWADSDSEPVFIGMTNDVKGSVRVDDNHFMKLKK